MLQPETRLCSERRELTAQQRWRTMLKPVDVYEPLRIPHGQAVMWYYLDRKEIRLDQAQAGAQPQHLGTRSRRHTCQVQINA